MTTADLPRVAKSSVIDQVVSAVAHSIHIWIEKDFIMKPDTSGDENGYALVTSNPSPTSRFVTDDKRSHSPSAARFLF